MPHRSDISVATTLIPTYNDGYEYSTSRSLPAARREVNVGGSITWDGNGHKDYHRCEHSKTLLLDGSWSFQSSTGGDFLRGFCRTGDGTWDEQNVYPGQPFYSVPPRLGEKTVGPSSVEIASRVARAAESVMSAPIAPMMNLPQAVLELKDMPRTIKACGDVLKWASRKYRPQQLRRLMNEPFRYIAGLYLADVFGIQPTVKDVKDFIGQMPRRFALGIRRVRYSRGQPIRAGWSCGRELLPPLTYAHSAAGRFTVRDRGWVVCYPSIASGANTGSICRDPSDTHDTGWPRVPCDTLYSSIAEGVCFARVGQDYAHDFSVLDDLTINASPLATIWELTPFSFVVDWFADLGRWLQDANRRQAARSTGFSLSGPIWFTRKVKSTEYHAIATREFSYNAEWGKTYISGDYYGTINVGWSTKAIVHLVPCMEHTEFVRGPAGVTWGLPGMNVKGLGNQGAFQFTTGLALLVQQCNHLR